MINGTKNTLSDLTLATDNYAGKGILTSRAIGLSGPHTFIIDYNNGFNGGYRNDTLSTDYSYATPASNCRYVLNDVKFNGVPVIGNTTFGTQPVYIFNKP